MNVRTIGLTIASVGLLGALPCGPPRNLREGLDTANRGADLAAKTARLNEARGRCERLGSEPVSYNEEYAVGSTTAVHFVAGNGGLAIAYEDAPKEQLADKAAVKFKEDSADYKVALYVAKVGKNLALQSGRADIKWTMGVLNNDGAVNAFSAPGGFVLITRGALSAAKNEDQLAGILAHEIGHIVKKHGLKYYSMQKVESCKAVATMKSEVAGELKDAARSFIPGVYELESLARSVDRLVSTGANAFNFDDPTNFDLIEMMGEKAGEAIAAGYSQQMEYEADQVAAELLLSAGYSVDEYGKFVSTLSGSKTHPGGPERQQKLAAYVKSKRTDDPFAGPESKRKPIPLQK